VATGTAPRESGPAKRKPTGKFVDYEKFIDGQLRKTRGQVKVVEIAHGLMILTVGTIAFFLIAAVLDHWVVGGGLSVLERIALFVGLIVGTGYCFARTVVPGLFGRVNPVYAAQTIERSKPSLKNSLINFLLFRQRREGVPQTVYNALEEQAAKNLSHVHLETAVDRTQLVHWGYTLVGFVVAFALYFILSPKKSAGHCSAGAVARGRIFKAPARVEHS